MATHNGLTLFGEARLGEDLVILPPDCQIYPVCSLQIQTTNNTVVDCDQAAIESYLEYQQFKENKRVT